MPAQTLLQQFLECRVVELKQTMFKELWLLFTEQETTRWLRRQRDVPKLEIIEKVKGIHGKDIETEAWAAIESDGNCLHIFLSAWESDNPKEVLSCDFIVCK